MEKGKAISSLKHKNFALSAGWKQRVPAGQKALWEAMSNREQQGWFGTWSMSLLLPQPLLQLLNLLLCFLLGAAVQAGAGWDLVPAELLESEWEQSWRSLCIECHWHSINLQTNPVPQHLAAGILLHKKPCCLQHYSNEMVSLVFPLPRSLALLATCHSNS